MKKPLKNHSRVVFLDRRASLNVIFQEKRGKKKAETPTSATPVGSKTPRRGATSRVAEDLPLENNGDTAEQAAQERTKVKTPPDFIAESKLTTNASVNVESKAQKLLSSGSPQSMEKSRPKKKAFARLRKLATILIRKQPQLQLPPSPNAPISYHPKEGSKRSARKEPRMKSERLQKSIKVSKLMSSSGTPDNSVHSPDLVRGTTSAKRLQQLTSPSPMQVPANPPPMPARRETSVPVWKRVTGTPIGPQNVKK